MLNLTKLDVNKLRIINNKVYTLHKINTSLEEEFKKFDTKTNLTFQ